MTLAEFYALVAALPLRFRHKVAQAAYRYADLRERGATRAVARQAVHARQDLEDALLLSGLRAEFNSIA